MQLSSLLRLISPGGGMGQNRLEDICTLVGKDATAPSGVPLKGNLALCALLSRRMSGDALPVRARFCTLGGYVIGRLTGEHVCHMTNAAPTGLVDVQNKRWNQPLLLRAGLDGWQYPRLIHDLSPVGEWRDALVYADLGDQQVCAAGAGLKPEQTLHISLGTAGLIGILTPQWESGPYENRPYVLPGVYLRTVSGLPGGRHMEGLATLLQEATRSLTGCHVSRQAVWDLLTQHTQPGAAGNLWDILSQPASSMLGAYYAAFAKAYVEGVQRLCFSPREIAFRWRRIAKFFLTKGAQRCSRVYRCAWRSFHLAGNGGHSALDYEAIARMMMHDYAQLLQSA